MDVAMGQIYHVPQNAFLVKVWNVMLYFHKVAYVQYLGEVDIIHTWVKNFFLFTTVQKL